MDFDLTAEQQEIRRVAREFADAPAAVAYGRVGISTQAFGGLASWLVNALNVVTGNLNFTSFPGSYPYEAGTPKATATTPPMRSWSSLMP